MTRLLEQAIDLVRDLPEAEQDAIARLMLEEIDSENDGTISSSNHPKS